MNRMPFGPDVVEETFRETGKGFGLLGAGSGSGKLRVAAVEKGILKKVKAAAVAAATTSGIATQGLHARPGSAASAAQVTSGFATSIAFTPVQGIELANPSARDAVSRHSALDSQGYFSSIGGFTGASSKPKTL
jgi:U4/U6 small nuclear ribonucleoprotein PRP31